jgi:hypothetical protein
VAAAQTTVTPVVSSGSTGVLAAVAVATPDTGAGLGVSGGLAALLVIAGSLAIVVAGRPREDGADGS